MIGSFCKLLKLHQRCQARLDLLLERQLKVELMHRRSLVLASNSLYRAKPTLRTHHPPQLARIVLFIDLRHHACWFLAAIKPWAKFWLVLESLREKIDRLEAVLGTCIIRWLWFANGDLSCSPFRPLTGLRVNCASHAMKWILLCESDTWLLWFVDVDLNFLWEVI